jgi:two-component system response regulator AtoC
MINVLVVDDDHNLRKVLRTELAASGFEAQEACDGEKALSLLGKQEFDVILLDLTMPGIAGLDVLKTIKQSELPGEVIILTANATIQTAVEAMKLGAYDYLTKPLRLEELDLIIRKAAEKSDLVRENKRLRTQLERRDTFPEIVTQAPVMRELLDTVRRVAPSNVPVHIYGESGVGKELVAHGIHAASDRSGQAIIAINCAAITESMFESELFGHEKGAFTGAVAQKPGLLEVASGGTLFIDEIGEMPVQIQVKLLRVLESGAFFRVGGVREIKVDIRLVSASNKDLVAESEKGAFRKDLYWRIAGVTLRVPPLRERADDIPLLAQYFLQKHVQFRNKTIAPDALKLLASYSWPGNVRELFHMLHRASLLSPDAVLEADRFPGLESEAPGVRHRRKLEDMERCHILKVLKETGGHRRKSAGILGIDPKTLYRKLQQYGIDN